MWRETQGGGQPVLSFLWSTRSGMSSAAALTARYVITANMWMSSSWLRSYVWPLMVLIKPQLLVAVLLKLELSVLKFDSFMMTCKQRQVLHTAPQLYLRNLRHGFILFFRATMAYNEMTIIDDYDYFYLKSHWIVVSWTFHAKYLRVCVFFFIFI